MHPNCFRAQKILITGGRGFIGTHLCNFIASRGGEVHATSRKIKTQVEGGIYIWNIDLKNSIKVEELVKSIKPDLIFHLASIVKGSRDLNLVLPMLRNNLLTTVNILTAARKTECRKVILAGSMEEPNQRSDAIPTSPYSVAKWATTGYGRMFHSLYDLPVVILRVFMVYGPGQFDFTKLIPYTIRETLSGRRPEISSGKRKVDWIYVQDVIDGYAAAALANKVDGAIIDIGSGERVSIKKIVTSITEMINPEIKPKFGVISDRKNEYSRIANVQKAFNLLKWVPKISIQDGLELTINWYSNIIGKRDV
jgi:UDP-glucose 4-epimerase